MPRYLDSLGNAWDVESDDVERLLRQALDLRHRLYYQMPSDPAEVTEQMLADFERWANELGATLASLVHKLGLWGTISPRDLLGPT